MNRDKRTVRLWVETGGKVIIPLDVWEALNRLTFERRGPSKVLTLPGKSRKERRTERRDRMAEIRRKVMEREGGRCELCGVPAAEAHHVISGGLRRHREGIDTVLALCSGCHRALHKGRPDALEHAHDYCLGSGMHEAAAALRRRLDKIYEARAAEARKAATT